MTLFAYWLVAQVNIRSHDIDMPRVGISEGEDATIASILTAVFSVIGAIALIVVVIGGLQYTMSQGNPQATNRAKDTIMYALIGLVICILAVAIVNFVVLGVTS